MSEYARASRRRARRASAGIAALAFLGIASCDTVERTVDFDRSADFSGYSTYAWSLEVPTQSEVGVPPVNPLINQRVQDAIERSLAARGYTPSGSPDFAVAFSIGVRERTYYQPAWVRYPAYDPVINRRFAPVYPRHVQRSYSEGTIVVDVFDVATGRAVWHGRASKPVDEGDTQPEAIQAIVDSILVDFPPRDGGGRKPPSSQ